MNRIIIAGIIAFFASGKLAAAGLPDSVQEVIQHDLPNCRIAATADYVPGWKEYYPESSQVPFCCSSDFNGDGRPDFAILLVGVNNELFLYAFFANNDSYKAVLVDAFEPIEKGIEAIIGVEKKGEWDSVTDKITVPNDGISTDFIIESLSFSYYFDGSTFQKFIYD